MLRSACDQTLADVDRDYSERMADTVVMALSQACDHTGGVSPEDGGAHPEPRGEHPEVARLLGKVTTYTADGASAAQKAGKFLRLKCRNLSLILRDVAHALRRSAEDPLRREKVYGEFWSKIFDDRHALIPDIQNSAEWRHRLLLAQKHLLATDGQMGGRLAVALKHFQFAKQRFDSAASPARKYCCLVVAIAILLAAQAADPRHPAALRKRAERLLEDMTPTHFVTAGLFADYCAEVLRFVRRFDRGDHDLANTVREKRDFFHRMNSLFRMANIFAEPRNEEEAGSATFIAISQAMAAGPIYYGDKVKHLWPGQRVLPRSRSSLI